MLRLFAIIAFRMANMLDWRGQTQISSGDTIRVHQTVVEGSKTRSQIFEGVVIRIRGHKGLKSFTVRKIATNSIGVEKIFPENSPTVTKIDIKWLVKKGIDVTVYTTNIDIEEKIEAGRETLVDGVKVWYFKKSFPKIRLRSPKSTSRNRVKSGGLS